MPDEQSPPKRATAKATVFIEVKLANSEKLIFDVETAKELETELGLALASLSPPRIVPAHQAKK
jgi:hypothetical protein